MHRLLANLSDQQQQAILILAKREGRTWKNKLRTMWMYANYPGYSSIAHTLQSVRNQFGPSWLVNVRLPKADFDMDVHDNTSLED